MDCKLVTLVFFTCCLFATLAAPAAKPEFAFIGAAPVVAAAPAVVTAHSSQVIARNYNGIAAPLIAAPAAPLVAAAPAATAVVANPYAALPYTSQFYTYV